MEPDSSSFCANNFEGCDTPALKMSGTEADETQSAYGDGGQGPGAPTPLSVLEVCISYHLTMEMIFSPPDQGVAGLSARDIKLIVDGGFNTVESVAYTWVSKYGNSRMQQLIYTDHAEF